MRWLDEKSQNRKYAALTATKTLNQRKPNENLVENKEMAKLRCSLDKNLQNNKNENDNATTSTNITYDSNVHGELDERKLEVNIETCKGVETEAMKRIRRSLQNNKKLKKNRNDYANLTGSVVNSASISVTCDNNLTETKKTKDSKGAGNKIIKGNVDKPSIETEAMKRIRGSLEHRNKSKEKKNAPATTSSSIFNPTSSTHSCQSGEGTGNAKTTEKGRKRKVADLHMDEKVSGKTHINTEKRKRMKLMKSNQNENYPSTSDYTTCEITNEQMEIDGEETVAAPARSRTASMKKAQETKRVIETAGVETEAMKMIRRKIELNTNKNENPPSHTITSTARVTRITKENKKVKSPEAVKRKTAVGYKPTDEMQKIKELIEQRSLNSQIFNATPSSRTPRKTNTGTTNTKIYHENRCHESVPKSNFTPSKMIEDGFDETEMITDNDEGNENEGDFESSSTSAMSVEVEQSDDNVAATSRRVTRSKTWERRVWRK